MTMHMYVWRPLPKLVKRVKYYHRSYRLRILLRVFQEPCACHPYSCRLFSALFRDFWMPSSTGGRGESSAERWPIASELDSLVHTIKDRRMSPWAETLSQAGDHSWESMLAPVNRLRIHEWCYWTEIFFFFKLCVHVCVTIIMWGVQCHVIA